jgi:ATP-dependent RNA helicase DHX29
MTLNLVQTKEYSEIMDESQEKLMPRIAITYGVLRRLGFSEDIVQECLNSIMGIELGEALDWVGSYMLSICSVI